MIKILAWHGNPALRDDTILDMKRHRMADELISGRYIEPSTTASKFVGCFHGCLVGQQIMDRMNLPPEDLMGRGIRWHEETEEAFGIPARLGQLLDMTFERMGEGRAAFAVETLEAMQPGADLRHVIRHVTMDLLDDPQRGYVGLCNSAQPPRDGRARSAYEGTVQALRAMSPDATGWGAHRVTTVVDRIAAILIPASAYDDSGGEHPAMYRELWDWVAQLTIKHIAAAPVEEG